MKLGVTVAGIGSNGIAARVARLRERVARELQPGARQRDGVPGQPVSDSRAAAMRPRDRAAGRPPFRSS
jgi:hypothetical protein